MIFLSKGNYLNVSNENLLNWNYSEARALETEVAIEWKLNLVVQGNTDGKK